MNTNGQANPPENPPSFPSSVPDWKVSDELARKAVVDRVTRFSSATRRMYVGQAMDELGRSASWRFVFTSRETRRKLASTFVETVEEGGDFEAFKAKAKTYGFSPMLIFFVLGIVWDILWYWWQHRETECKTY